MAPFYASSVFLWPCRSLKKRSTLGGGSFHENNTTLYLHVAEQKNRRTRKQAYRRTDVQTNGLTKHGFMTLDVTEYPWEGQVKDSHGDAPETPTSA